MLFSLKKIKNKKKIGRGGSFIEVKSKIEIVYIYLVQCDFKVCTVMTQCMYMFSSGENTSDLLSANFKKYPIQCYLL